MNVSGTSGAKEDDEFDKVKSRNETLVVGRTNSAGASGWRITAATVSRD